MLENLIHTDLLAWREASRGAAEILYWRTPSQQEVDFVVETPERVLSVEVQTSSRVRPADTRHLRAFLEEYPDLADAGLMLYTGDHTDWIVDDVLAVPWWQVL